MDSSPIGSAEDKTFLLIRLPKETVQRCREGNSKVGTVFVYDDQRVEFQDDKSFKLYTLMRNSQANGKTNTSSHRKDNQIPAVEESDLLEVSLQKDEAVHLGKVKLSTLLAVPKVDEKDVLAVFG